MENSWLVGGVLALLAAVLVALLVFGRPSEVEDSAAPVVVTPPVATEPVVAPVVAAEPSATEPVIPAAPAATEPVPAAEPTSAAE